MRRAGSGVIGGAALVVALLAVLVTTAATAAAAAPTNDQFGQAQTVTVPSTISASSTDATAQPDEPAGSCWYLSDPAETTIWFQFTAAADGLVSVSTAGSTYDTQLAVYTGANLSGLSEVACGEDNAGVHAETTVDATTGMTYFIQVDGYTGATGSLSLVMDSTVPSPDCDGQAPVPAGLQLQSEWGMGDPGIQHVTYGIFAVWWYDTTNHLVDATVLAHRLAEVRCDSLIDLSMQDPPNPAGGHYVNVYIHHGAADPFPADWGAGVGTDQFGVPFLGLPADTVNDPAFFAHEGFHFFQWADNSYPYSGDSAWIIESSADWYASIAYPSDNAFGAAWGVEGNPHLSPWHSFDNGAPGDPQNDWVGAHFYGMQVWLWYLTEHVGIERSVITDGFYEGAPTLPQEVMFNAIGPTAYRTHFGDWAAATANDFAYLPPGAPAAIRAAAPSIPGDFPTIAELTDQGTDGMTRPPSQLTPRGWGYNVIRIHNSADAIYRIDIDADELGSQGTPALFEARAVITGTSGSRTESIFLFNGLDGGLTFPVTAADARIDITVAAVPDHFSGFQTYGYEYSVVRTAGSHPETYCDGALATMVVGSYGVATEGSDVIVGSSGPDVIDALGGNDIVCAVEGDDQVVGGHGNDTLLGGDGADVMRGNTGVDLLYGGPGNDRLLGGIGDDVLVGESGNDYLGGFGGADVIEGGDGDEVIFGGFGADTIDGGSGNDAIHGLIGDDIIVGGPGHDVLDGDRGNDQINGGDGDDIIRGGNANDSLFGDDGDDSVSGGRADDALSGGDGTDICAGNKHIVADTADATCEQSFGVP